MKNILLILCLSFGTFFHAKAQNGNNREEKIQALYIAYITQQLKLNEDEAKQFWPVHAQYDAEIKAVATNPNELEMQQASLNIKKKYQDRFSKILGPARTNDFYKTDTEFRKRMVERLRKLREQNKNGKMNRF